MSNEMNGASGNGRVQTRNLHAEPELTVLGHTFPSSGPQVCLAAGASEPLP